MLCQVYFSFKNLNVQSIVYQFYFNKVEKEQLLRKIKGKLENGKKTETNFSALQEAEVRILKGKEASRPCFSEFQVTSKAS